MVNGLPNQDTYSAYINYFPFGGMVEFPRTRNSVLKNMSMQIDSFACEEGEYQYENCYTPKPNKKFLLTFTASVYAVGAHNEPEPTALTSSTETFRILYRPSTETSCPLTGEGKGSARTATSGDCCRRSSSSTSARKWWFPTRRSS